MRFESQVLRDLCFLLGGFHDLLHCCTVGNHYTVIAHLDTTKELFGKISRYIIYGMFLRVYQS